MRLFDGEARWLAGCCVAALLALLDDFRLACHREKGRQPVVVLHDVVGHPPAGILPGQRTSNGMRNAPSQFVSFSLRNGVMPASGQEFM